MIAGGRWAGPGIFASLCLAILAISAQARIIRSTNLRFDVSGKPAPKLLPSSSSHALAACRSSLVGKGIIGICKVRR